jgi:hypothetical protein
MLIQFVARNYSVNREEIRQMCLHQIPAGEFALRIHVGIDWLIAEDRLVIFIELTSIRCPLRSSYRSHSAGILCKLNEHF